MFFELLCETKSMQENFKHKKPQQIGILENAEDGEGKWRALTLEQQRKRPRTHQNRSFSVFVHLLCQTKNTGSEMEKKKQKEKTQKTVGKMKKCGVKNRIFRCNKNTEDGEGNENLRRVRLCMYVGTVEGSQWWDKQEHEQQRRHQKLPLVFHSIEQQYQHIVFHVFFSRERKETRNQATGM